MVGHRPDHPDFLPFANFLRHDISNIAQREATMSKNKAAASFNKQNIKNLRAAIIEGEASGPTIAFDMEEFLTSKLDKSFIVFTNQPNLNQN